MTKTIIEAGHYYLAHGPTIWSVAGWKTMEKIRVNGEGTMLFIDDIHETGDMSQREFNLPVQNFSPPADHVIMESSIGGEALIILERLMQLSKRQRARQKSDGRWFCSGLPITNEFGYPNCVLLDTGLTLLKQQLGYDYCINILPYYYKEEQTGLLRLVRKAIPNFNLKVILFDLEGNSWEMAQSTNE